MGDNFRSSSAASGTRFVDTSRLFSPHNHWPALQCLWDTQRVSLSVAPESRPSITFPHHPPAVKSQPSGHKAEILRHHRAETAHDTVIQLPEVLHEHPAARRRTAHWECYESIISRRPFAPLASRLSISAPSGGLSRPPRRTEQTPFIRACLANGVLLLDANRPIRLPSLRVTSLDLLKRAPAERLPCEGLDHTLSVRRLYTAVDYDLAASQSATPLPNPPRQPAQPRSAGLLAHELPGVDRDPPPRAHSTELDKRASVEQNRRSSLTARVPTGAGATALMPFLLYATRKEVLTFKGCRGRCFVRSVADGALPSAAFVPAVSGWGLHPSLPTAMQPLRGWCERGRCAPLFDDETHVVSENKKVEIREGVA
ncbi:hypothetical protein BU16DRAFT_532471 [Lophium mytilinum]|uniref:Uncharacterized protein n=1 Tax=Lophium mytilinum TaxID=390894 RepID=A0A6A6RBG2_9PEZI|nr:hypothetical protein BU16DRAFT_532471 [Lophium mytilinum]